MVTIVGGSAWVDKTGKECSMAVDELVEGIISGGLGIDISIIRRVIRGVVGVGWLIISRGYTVVVIFRTSEGHDFLGDIRSVVQAIIEAIRK